MNFRTLLLNKSGLPHQILSWEDAVTLLYQEKVIVLEEYEETVSSPSTTYQVPAVMQLCTDVRRNKKGVKFSRINVLTRDGFKCQYCGERFMPKALNYDHVIPRCRGGKTDWTNIVTSCYPCNERKGHRTLEQAGMQLLRKPAKPSSLPLHAVFVTSSIPDAWKPYLEAVTVHSQGAGSYLIA